MDAEFQSLINGSIGTPSQVRIYRQAIFQIEQEIQRQDEHAGGDFGDGFTAGRNVKVTGTVNHTGSGERYSSPVSPADFGSNVETDFGAGTNAMLDSNEIEISNTLSHVESLSDVIVFNFGINGGIANFIFDALTANSPVRSGRYLHSHVVFADGVLVEDIANIPDESTIGEYLFVNTLPYARKIEQGESPMAPNGVYEIVANQAQERYGGACIVEFIDYVGTYGVMAEATNASYGRRTRQHMNKAENRFPAIRVTFPNK